MNQSGVRRALLQYQLGGERQWVAFDAPLDTIVAELNAHCDVAGLCRGFPQRLQDLVYS